MMLYSFLRFSSIAAIAAAQVFTTFTPDDSPNPPCYVCCASSEPCDMVVTNPDAIIPLPAFTGMAMATCSDVQKFGEDMLMLPEFACDLLDRDDFRSECGCQSPFVEEDTILGISVLLPTDPTAAPVADIPPPPLITLSLPSDIPSMVPSDAPSMVPSDAPSMVPSDVPSSLPSDIPSMQPLLRKRA